MNQEELIKKTYSFYEFTEQDDEVYFVTEEEEIDELNEDLDEEEAYEEETIYAPFGPNGPIIRYRNYTIEYTPDDNQ